MRILAFVSVGADAGYESAAQLRLARDSVDTMSGDDRRVRQKEALDCRSVVQFLGLSHGHDRCHLRTDICDVLLLKIEKFVRVREGYLRC